MGEPLRMNPNAFLSSLLEFCADSVSTCSRHGAGKKCVSVGFTAASALLLLISCFLLACQRCRSQRGHPGEATTFFYSLLGNLCGLVGAILSRQLHIQVLMGAVAAAVDAVLVTFFWCLPVLLCWNSQADRRLRMMKRRRQHLLAVCVLMVVAGGFLPSRITHLPPDGPLIQRRLMHITIQGKHTLLMGNTEILGYILGLLSFVIACTSRLPALLTTYTGQMSTWVNLFSGLLCSLAGVLYSAAMLLYDTQSAFHLRIMPWLLSAVCCVTLDLLIVVIYVCRRGARQKLASYSPDTESLLGCSHIPTKDKDATKRQRKQLVNAAETKKAKHIQNMTEMGRYMDVSVQPAGEEEMCEAEVQNQLSSQTLRVTRVNSFCSSDTSYDSSTVNSDLEWDFEEENSKWMEPTEKMFVPGGLPPNSKHFTVCAYAMSGLSQNTLSGRAERESLSHAS